MRASLIALALIAALAGCQHAPARQPAAAGAVAAHDNLNAVAWMQRSAEYAATASTVFQAAAMQLPQAVADPDWNALVPGDRGPQATLPPAIILDLDETVLDNSPYQARMIRDRQAFADASWRAWVEERGAGAIPGAVPFLQAAQRAGVAVFYVSNRDHDQNAATAAVLQRLGAPVAAGAILGKGMQVDGCSQASASDKTCRRRWVGARHRVVMQFGDALGDFLQPASSHPDARREALAPYQGWFGSRWWMLPNPSYGAWEGSLLGDAPASLQRQRKLDQLSY